MDPKRLKPKVYLVVDVWFHIGEYISNENLVDIMVLSKGIYSLVNSNWSWRRRCEREFLKEHISHVKEWCTSCNDYKVVYRDILGSNNLREGDKILFYSLRKYYIPSAANHYYVSGISDIFVKMKVFKIKKYVNNRPLKLHLFDWFETNSVKQKPKNIRISWRNLHISTNNENDFSMDIQFGVISFGFSTLISEDSDKFFGNSVSCVFCDNNGHGEVDDEILYSVANDSSQILFSNDDLLGTKVKFLSFNYCGRNISRKYHSIESDEDEEIKMEKLRRLLHKYSNKYQEMDMFHETCLDAKIPGQKVYYNFTFSKFEEKSGDKKGKMCVSRFVSSISKEKELNSVNYRGDLHLDKEKQGYDVMISCCGKFLAFTVVQVENGSCKFFLGGKYLKDGRITGFLVDPSRITEESKIHGVFTLTPSWKF